jgi:hypothetical protein
VRCEVNGMILQRTVHTACTKLYEELMLMWNAHVARPDM